MARIKVLEKDLGELQRKVLEAVYIKLRGATLNRNNRYFLLELYLPLLREDISGEHTTDHCTASALRP